MVDGVNSFEYIKEKVVEKEWGKTEAWRLDEQAMSFRVVEKVNAGLY